MPGVCHCPVPRVSTTTLTAGVEPTICISRRSLLARAPLVLSRSVPFWKTITVYLAMAPVAAGGVGAGVGAGDGRAGQLMDCGPASTRKAPR